MPKILLEFVIFEKDAIIYDLTGGVTMINKLFRVVFGIFSCMSILAFCISFNLSKPEGQTIDKKVNSGYEEVKIEEKYVGNKSILENARTNIVENDAIVNEIIDLTNSYRNEVGLNSLKYDKNLSIAANIRAMEIALYNKFEHVRPNGLSYSSVLKDLQIKTRVNGENIAYGYISPSEVSEAWKNSKGHYENMINKKYNKIGVGYFKYNNVIYWVQIFTN